MAANSAQQAMLNLGIRPRPDYSRMGVPKIRHSGDLDALRRAALADDAGPGSEAYDTWLAALQQGADVGVPDADVFNGAIPQSIEEQQERAYEAAQQRLQHFVNPHPALYQLTNAQGVPLAHLDVESVRQNIALMMAEAAPHERAALAELANVVEESGASSWGITYEAVEDRMEWQAPTIRSSDAYSEWRAAQGRVKQGMDALAIQRGDEDAQLLSGVSADGLSYSVADDLVYQAQQLSNNGD